MKLSYNRTVERYIISEQGKLLQAVVDLGDALRLMGMEPEESDRVLPPPADDKDFDLGELFELFEVE